MKTIAPEQENENEKTAPEQKNDNEQTAPEQESENKNKSIPDKKTRITNHRFSSSLRASVVLNKAKCFGN